MASFNLKGFVAVPSLEGFNSCRKSDLIEIARHFDVDVSTALSVSEYRKTLLTALVTQGVLCMPESSGGVVGGASVEAVVSLAREGAGGTVEHSGFSPRIDFARRL